METWVVQAKFRGAPTQLLGPGVVDEITVAIGAYGATRAIIAASTGFSPSTVIVADRRSADIGVPIYLWSGDTLLRDVRRLPLYAQHRQRPRDYQNEAIDAIGKRMEQGAHSALLLMATGLGKTRVAAGVVENWLRWHGSQNILIVAPSLELVPQLEAALWQFLPKNVPTHILTGTEKPTFDDGVTVATQQSLVRRPDDLCRTVRVSHRRRSSSCACGRVSQTPKRLSPSIPSGNDGHPMEGG